MIEERKEIVMAKSFSYHHETTKNGETKFRGVSYETGRGWHTYSSTTPAKDGSMSKINNMCQNKKVVVVGGGIAGGVVALIIAGVNLANKLTEAKRANRVKDLDDSLRKSANIAAGIAEQEEQEDFKNQW